MAYESQGAVVFYQNTTGNVSTAAAAKVEEVRNVSGVAPTAGQIDVTHLGSTAKEYLVGLYDGGEVSLDVNWTGSTNATSMQYVMRTAHFARTKGAFGIGLQDSAKTLIRGECYVSGFSLNIGVDGALQASFRLRPTAGFSFTTYTT